MAWVYSKGSDQTGHMPILIRVFAVHMKKAQALGYVLSAQLRCWFDSEYTQADLNFCRDDFVGFVMVCLTRYQSDLGTKRTLSINVKS